MGATRRFDLAAKARVAPRAPAGGGGSRSPDPLALSAAVALGCALALTLAIGAFAAVSLILPRSETLESVWWLAAFALVTPAAALATARLLPGARAPEGRRALMTTAAYALLALCGSLCLARAVGSAPLSLFLVPASLLAALALSRRAPTVRLQRSPKLAAAAAAAAGCLGVAAFLPRAAREPGVLILGTLMLALTPAIAVALRRCAQGPPVRLVLGILIPLALALLAWDVSFQPLTSHQDFYLGPVNELRHGRYMLVDDYSQYGVGVIYFLEAILAPLPFGYGTLVLALGVLTAITYAAVYAVLRIATRSLALAALGTLAALLAGPIATLGRATQYPSAGFLRFGIPWLLVCALVVAYRRDRPARPALLAAYALVGIAAVWSFETAFYTVATFVVSVAAIAASERDGRRLRCALEHLAAGPGPPSRRSASSSRRPRSGAAARRTSAATSTSCVSTR